MTEQYWVQDAFIGRVAGPFDTPEEADQRLAELQRNGPHAMLIVGRTPSTSEPSDELMPYSYVVRTWTEKNPYGTGSDVTRYDAPHVVDSNNIHRTFCGLAVDLFEPLSGPVNFGMACHACKLGIARRASA